MGDTCDGSTETAVNVTCFDSAGDSSANQQNFYDTFFVSSNDSSDNTNHQFYHNSNKHSHQHH